MAGRGEKGTGSPRLQPWPNKKRAPTVSLIRIMINGFLVVRLPSENEVVPSERVLPSVNGIFYAGIDRCAWDDLYDEDYHTGKTPPEVASIAKGIYDDCVDVSGIVLARDFDDAMAFSTTQIERLEETERSSQFDPSSWNEARAARPRKSRSRGLASTRWSRRGGR